jgi:tRNA-dihydrouridine synthase
MAEFRFTPRPIDFSDGLFLAPMVRSSTLPMRMTSFEFGAAGAWTEEYVAQKLAGLTRTVRRSVLFPWQVKRLEEDTGVDPLDPLVPSHVGPIVEYRDLDPHDRPPPALPFAEASSVTARPGVKRPHPCIKPAKNDPRPVFCTCRDEGGPVVLQIGAADAVTALAGASAVAADVSAIDLNMGCRRSFSTHAGMGAELLRPENQATAIDILKTLVRNLNVPVSAKLRVLDTTADTVDLVRRLQATGVSALTIHARRPSEERTDPHRWAEIRDLMQQLPSLGHDGNCPLIVNGSVFSPEDIPRIRAATGVRPVMIARGACGNFGIFSPTPISREHCARRMLYHSLCTSTHFAACKFNCLALTAPPGDKQLRLDLRKTRQSVAEAKTYPALAHLFNYVDPAVGVEANVSSLHLPSQQPSF